MQPAVDTHFDSLVEAFHGDQLARHPVFATMLGRHEHDMRLEDVTLDGARAEAAAIRRFREALAAIPVDQLGADRALDHAWLLANTDGQLQRIEDFRPLERDPDRYSSGVTEAAFALLNREFAPAPDRAELLLMRLAGMPEQLEEARKNLADPPEVLTTIALDQIDGNRSFFRDTLPNALASQIDAHQLTRLRAACERVDVALARYGDFLQEDVLPRSTGTMAIGAEAYRRKIYADELLDEPLERLLKLGEANLLADQQAMREAAAIAAPGLTVQQAIARLGATHVSEEALLAATQSTLFELVDFIQAHDVLTLPQGPALHVIETPPFLRATVSAAMDTPGPFEERGTDCYYYMTPPNPAWPKEERESYMAQWNRPQLTNLSAHEAYPGHYVQFLWLKQYPTLSRRVLWCPSNVEGWAHYGEQLMVELGFREHDPWYKVAQLHDSLMRSARLVVGLRMHTAGMDLAEARAFYEREAYLAPPVAKAEAWRGASDPTYGYYTLGKLMLLKLREDVRRERGAAFKLRRFHDEFLRMGPLPIPLARRAMGLDAASPAL